MKFTVCPEAYIRASWFCIYYLVISFRNTFWRRRPRNVIGDIESIGFAECERTSAPNTAYKNVKANISTSRIWVTICNDNLNSLFHTIS